MYYVDEIPPPKILRIPKTQHSVNLPLKYAYDEKEKRQRKRDEARARIRGVAHISPWSARKCKLTAEIEDCDYLSLPFASYIYIFFCACRGVHRFE